MTSASTAGSPRSSSRGRTRGTPAGSSSSATSSACRKLLRRKTYPLKGWNSWVPVKEKLKMPPDLVWAYCAITMTFWTWKKNLTKTRRLPWISCCFWLAF